MMIKFENVSAEYIKKRKAIDNITFEIPKNTVTALVGKNGSGKSTILKCMYAGLKYSGNIFADGVNLKKISPKERAKIISALPQRVLPLSVTVKELVGFGRSPYAKNWAYMSEDDIKIVNNAMALAEIAEFSHKYTDTLSGGELQKAYVAMVVAQDTPVAVFDEPTAYMDIGAQKMLFELMLKLKANGKTVIAATHDLNLAVKYADNIIIAEAGKILFCGSTDECLSKHKIESAFDVKRYEASDGTEKNTIFF